MVNASSILALPQCNKAGFKTNKKMEEQEKVAKLQEIVMQQNRVIEMANLYISDMQELLQLQKDYILVLDEQVSYYQLLKQTLWN